MQVRYVFNIMNVFTIKDLESLSGIKAHTIRIWEQRYSFIKPQRTDTNIRYYSNEELRSILNIALLNKYGYKISHIDKMNDEDINQNILNLTEGEAQKDRLIKELIESMIYLDLVKLEGIIDEFIMLHGIEKTISQLFFPFMERIGILWLTNHINPAQEHLVSNIIRQKIIVGIEKLSPPNQKETPTILLFLPEGEYHELGLLFIYYLLKQKQVAVLYLGSNVPLKDVEYIVKLKKPSVLYSHVTSIPGNFQFERFLTQLHKSFSHLPIVVSGVMAQHYKKEIPKGISLRRSLAEVYHFVEEI